MKQRLMLKNESLQATQGGAALLSAMLTVTLVATFAAAALWQQYRSIEVETAERGRVQSSWLLAGALDWSRLQLFIDKTNPKTAAKDDLTENWSHGLPEARLSAFLDADQNNSGGKTAEESVDVFLSGQMTDAQSFLNVYNLVDAGKPSPLDYAAFVKLFAMLKLPIAELDELVKNLMAAKDITAVNGNAPLMPQHVRQLTWLGLSPASLDKLIPYVTLLPEHTAVNLNTAAAEVIYAIVPNLQLADAKLVVFSRGSNPFSSIGDATKAVPALGQLDSHEHSVATNFFQINGRLRLEQTLVEEQTLVRRDNFGNITTLWRERAVVASPEPAT
jgi:general secretion pathway protein K